MRKDVYESLENNSKLLQFVRANPIWYRKLTRNPKDLQTMILASKDYYKQTFPHRIQQFNQSLQLASFMLQMYQGMKQND